MARKPRKDHRTVLVHFGFARPEQVESGSSSAASSAPTPTTLPHWPAATRKSASAPERAANMVPHGRRAEARRVALLPLRHADGPGQAAATGLGRGQPPDLRRRGGRTEHRVPLDVALKADHHRRRVLDPAWRTRSARSRSARTPTSPFWTRAPTTWRPGSEGHRGLGHDARGPPAARDGHEGSREVGCSVDGDRSRSNDGAGRQHARERSRSEPCDPAVTGSPALRSGGPMRTRQVLFVISVYRARSRSRCSRRSRKGARSGGWSRRASRCPASTRPRALMATSDSSRWHFDEAAKARSGSVSAHRTLTRCSHADLPPSARS